MNEVNSHEIMKWLNDMQRDRFVKFQALFESDGWPLIVEMAQAYSAAHAAQQTVAKTWEEVLVARGSQRVWAAVANWADTVMTEFEVVAEQAKEADAGVATELEDE